MPCGLSVSAVFLCSRPAKSEWKNGKLTEKRSRNETFFILQLGMQNVVVVADVVVAAFIANAFAFCIFHEISHVVRARERNVARENIKNF